MKKAALVVLSILLLGSIAVGINYYLAIPGLKRAECSIGLKALGLALMLYSADYDGYSPPVGSWKIGTWTYIEALRTGRLRLNEFFDFTTTDERVKDEEWSEYAVSTAFQNASIENPIHCPSATFKGPQFAMFNAASGINITQTIPMDFIGEVQDGKPDYRHSGKMNILRTNGSVYQQKAPGK